MRISVFFAGAGLFCLFGTMGCDSMPAGGGPQADSISSVLQSPALPPAPAPSSNPSPAQVLFSDSYSNVTDGLCFADGQHMGLWELAFSGYGCNQFASTRTGHVVLEAPAVSRSINETHAALMISPVISGDAVYQVSMKTVKQLRQGSAPNPWEVAWFLWNYTDGAHFYSINLKPNGWEVGKEDPAYPGAQRFLATGSSPVFPIGNWYDVKVVQVGNSITVYVDGKLLATATDNERPYSSGSVGLYNEDSQVMFGPVQVSRP
jgi:hypothetical protein